MTKKIYENSIRYWPVGERPRERLLRDGPESLSDAELLAIFLRTGVKGKSAIDLGRHLLKEFNGLRGLYAAGYHELKKIKGMGDAKVASLMAAIELGRRYVREPVERGQSIRNPEDVYQLLIHSMSDLDYEVFKVIFCNAKHEVLAIEDVFRGTINSSEVHPREIVKLGLKKAAQAIICAHNHPSGNPEPSQEDRRVTAALKEACRLMEMSLLDHIIIGHDRYWSFAEKGEL